MVESSPESTVLMANGSLFSVTAVTRDACEVVGDAPAMTVATLLPFDGLIVVAGSMPSYPLDKRSGLQDKILLQGRKLRAAGHLCTTAEELIREAPLLRLRNAKDHDDSIGQALEDLIFSTLEKLQEEEGDKPLFGDWGDDEDEDDDDFSGEPVPTHVGALAGLTGEERDVAIDAHFRETMAGALQMFDESIEREYFRRVPVRTLAQALDCRPLRELQGMARAMLHDPSPTGNKKKLIATLHEAFMEMSALSALAFLEADHGSVAALAESAWRAGGMVEMSRAEHDALPTKEKWRSFDPFLNIFVWDDKIAAVVPDEIVASMDEEDWELVRREQSYRRHARHLITVYLDLCGVISIDKLAELYLRYYPDELGREGFEEFLEHDGPTDFSRYDMWVYQDQTYVIIPMLVEKEVADELGRDEGAFIDGDALDEFDEPTDEELFRRHLLECHQDEPWEVPGRTAEELEAYHVFRSLKELPSCRALQEYLDAHVPEGEDDYMYAEGVIGELVEMVQFEPAPAEVIYELEDMGVNLEDIAGPGGMLTLITALLNDIPLWTNNGWSPRALMEREK